MSGLKRTDDAWVLQDSTSHFQDQRSGGAPTASYHNLGSIERSFDQMAMKYDISGYGNDTFRPVKGSSAVLSSLPGSSMNDRNNHQFLDLLDDQDQDYQSEVPSMTRGSSSRSASSSIIFCSTCENSSEKCQCQQQLSRFNSEIEFGPIAQHERINRFESPLQLETPPSGTPMLRSSTALFLTPPPIIGWKSDISPQSSGRNNADPDHFPDVFYNDQQAAGRDHNENVIEESEDDEETSNSDEEILSDYLTDFGDDIEALVLNAVGGDLELAALLIPMFHKLQYTETHTNITQKVDAWHTAVSEVPSVSSSGQTPTSNYPSTGGNDDSRDNSSRKRRRGDYSTISTADRGIGRDEEDEDDDDQEPKAGGEDEEAGVIRDLPRLACPFNKSDPVKYGIRRDVTESAGKPQYRICAGPGFSTIQRLKEHLKRKHYPVQCDRCYTIFPGTDRAVCVRDLQAHRQQLKICERRNDNLKEGISEAQWAQLDKKKSAKQSKTSSRVEKYWEIWDILFPNIPRPKTPWYDDRENRKTFQTSPESERFGYIFSGMLERQVLDQRIRFPEGEEQNMKSRVEALARDAFSLFSRVTVPPITSSTNSSSSRSHPQTSNFGGSCTNISTPYTQMSTPQSYVGLQSSIPEAQPSIFQVSTIAVEDPQSSTSRLVTMPRSGLNYSSENIPGFPMNMRNIMGPPPQSQHPSPMPFDVQNPTAYDTWNYDFDYSSGMLCSANVDRRVERTESNQTTLPSIRESLMKERNSTD